MVNSPAIQRPALIEKIAQDKLSGLAFWEDLDTSERNELQTSVLDVNTELAGQFKSIFRTGKIISRIYDITNPHGGFRRTVDQMWGEVLPISTAYRWMNIYKQVRDQVSESVVDVAVASGIQLVSGNEKRPFGKYTNFVKRLPPPTEGGVRAAKEWVETLKEQKDRLRSRGPQTIDLETDRSTLTKETYLYVRARAARLKGRDKSRYLEDLAGYFLRMAGIGSAKLISPTAPPEEWESIRRGRPSKKDKAEKAA